LAALFAITLRRFLASFLARAYASEANQCVLIATDHTAYDYDWIVRHAKLVIDTRNAAANVKAPRGKVVKA